MDLSSRKWGKTSSPFLLSVACQLAPLPQQGCLCPLLLSFPSVASASSAPVTFLLACWSISENVFISDPSACLCPCSHIHTIFVLLSLCPPLSLSSAYSHPLLPDSPLHVCHLPPSWVLGKSTGLGTKKHWFQISDLL